MSLCAETFTNELSSWNDAMLTAMYSATRPSISGTPIASGASGTSKNASTRPGKAATKKRR